jgi:hypothetical protein
MKILYGAANRVGSNLQLSRLLKHTPNIDISIAGYINNKYQLSYIDWSLDYIDSKSTVNKSKLIKEFASKIEYWKPKLIISDCEPITATVARLLNITLWTCSPINFVPGVSWKYNKKQIPFPALPKANRNFIYSPFIDVANFIAKPEYEWIRPYYADSCDDVFCVGETSLIADAIYNNKRPCIAPFSGDLEAEINASIIESLGIGKNIGDIRKARPLYINESIKHFISENHSPIVLDKKQIKFLHQEIINEI